MGHELDALRSAVDEIASLRAEDLSADDRRAYVVALEQLRTRMTAALLHVVGVFALRADWAADETRDAPGWIKNRTGASRVSAARDVRLARRLRDMPRFEEALAGATITEEHARLMAGGINARTWWNFTHDEEMLVGIAPRVNADDFAVAIAKWKELADPDGAEPANEKPDELHASMTSTGRVIGKFSLSGDRAVAFMDMLTAKTDEL